jgi:predicted phosphoadenosine phosphosulfate sulfurtransferase
MANATLHFATISLASIAALAPGAWVSWIGWIATAAFGASYFAKTPKALRMVQACAALLWIAYGFIIHAMPVVVANAIVAGAAVWSSFASPKAEAVTETPRQF